MPLEMYEYDSGKDYTIWKGADSDHTVFVVEEPSFNDHKEMHVFFTEEEMRKYIRSMP